MKLDTFDLDQLAEYLKEQGQTLETATKEAETRALEKAQLEKRLNLLQESLPQIKAKKEKLEHLEASQDADKARALLEQIDNEIERISAILAGVAPANPPEESSAQEAPVAVDSAQANQEEVSLEHLALFTDPCAHLPHLRDNSDLLSYLIFHRAKQLSNLQHIFSPAELRVEIAIASSIGRLIQARGKIDEHTAAKGELPKAFSILAGITKDNPQIGHVPALNSRYELDWESYLIDALKARKRSVQDRLAKEQERVLREEQHRLVEPLIDELQQLSEEGTPTFEDVIETVEELVEFGAATDERLISIVQPFAEQLVGGHLRPLRRALQRRLGAKAEAKEIPLAEAEAETEGSPETPKYTKGLKGKKVLVIGGQPRAQRRDAWQKTFEPAALDWVGAEQAEGNVTSWLANGRYDVVFALIRFISHEACIESKEACKKHNGIFVPIPQGYGTSALSNNFDEIADNPKPASKPAKKAAKKTSKRKAKETA